MIGSLIGLIFFFVLVVGTEYRKYRKRRWRKKNTIYLNIKGKIIDKYIISEPYYVHVPVGIRTRLDLRTLYMLIYNVEDSCGKTLKVKVAQSEFHEHINYDEYLDVGEEISWKIKKYPETDIYIFVDNVQ